MYTIHRIAEDANVPGAVRTVLRKFRAHPLGTGPTVNYVEVKGIGAYAPKVYNITVTNATMSDVPEWGSKVSPISVLEGRHFERLQPLNKRTYLISSAKSFGEGRPIYDFQIAYSADPEKMKPMPLDAPFTSPEEGGREVRLTDDELINLNVFLNTPARFQQEEMDKDTMARLKDLGMMSEGYKELKSVPQVKKDMGEAQNKMAERLSKVVDSMYALLLSDTVIDSITLPTGTTKGLVMGIESLINTMKSAGLYDYIKKNSPLVLQELDKATTAIIQNNVAGVLDFNLHINEAFNLLMEAVVANEGERGKAIVKSIIGPPTLEIEKVLEEAYHQDPELKLAETIKRLENWETYLENTKMDGNGLKSMRETLQNVSDQYGILEKQKDTRTVQPKSVEELEGLAELLLNNLSITEDELQNAQAMEVSELAQAIGTQTLNLPSVQKEIREQQELLAKQKAALAQERAQKSQEQRERLERAIEETGARIEDLKERLGEEYKSISKTKIAPKAYAKFLPEFQKSFKDAEQTIQSTKVSNPEDVYSRVRELLNGAILESYDVKVEKL